MTNKYVHIKFLGRKFVIYEEIPFKKYLVNIFGELIGTFTLVFLGCATDTLLLPHLDVTLSFGLAVMVAVQAITSSTIQEAYKDRRGVGPCTPIKHPTIAGWQVCLCEFVLTFLLVMVCGAVWDWRNKERFDSVSIRFGLVIGVLAIAGGQISGANMNPARTLGPCLNNNDFLDYHWAYWAGPLLAGVVGGLLYRLLFDTPEPGVDDVSDDK